MPKQYGTPGPRSIYPSAATSPSLAVCDPMAQLLFDRLIGQADDQGRLQGDIYLVKAACMPKIATATPNRIKKWLGELEEHHMIQRYEAAGQELIQLSKWWTFQNSARWIYVSRWPAPDGWDEHEPKVPKDENLPAEFRNGSGGHSGRFPERFQNNSGTVPDSRARVPDQTQPNQTGPASLPTPPSLSPQQRRLTLSASVAVAEQILANPEASEPAKAAATKAIDKANAALEQLPAPDEDDVDFSEPDQGSGDETPESPSGG